MRRPLIVALRKRDKSLADQVQRAASSIPLNVAEGGKRRRLDPPHHDRMAVGSCAEVRAALQVVAAWQHLGAEQVAEADKLLDRAAALLFELVTRKR